MVFCWLIVRIYYNDNVLLRDYKMALSPEGREALDVELSPFKRWDIIADIRGEIIWIFDKVAYHWWNPEYPIGRYIFADFQKAISKQWRSKREVFENWCWDDDAYIDRKKHNLWFNYRLATEEEKQIFNVLIAAKSGENEEKRWETSVEKKPKKDFLSSLMEWRVDGEAREKFLIEIGKFGEEDSEIEVDVFEEKLKIFWMNNPTIRHIYY